MPDRQSLEPQDAVQGFFADRLSRPHYLRDWQASGLRLRRWLINGFCFYLKERRKIQGRRRAGELPQSLAAADQGPEAATERAFAVSLVREALRIGQESCAREGLAYHWQLFLRHNLRGLSYAQLAEEFGVDQRRAAVMGRTAKNRFGAALRYLLAREGVPPGEIETEIRSLMEAVSCT